MDDKLEQKNKQVIFALVIKTASMIPSLEKGNKNEYGKYDYVSIDDYYKEVASIALKNGLGWIVREVSSEIKEKSILYVYEFDLYSDTGAFSPVVSRLSVVHPIQGAQTSGSALSYAEKLFMRTLFKVRTGELDADSTDPKSLNDNSFKGPIPSAIKPKPALPKTEGPKPTQNELMVLAEKLTEFENEVATVNVDNITRVAHGAEIAVEIVRIFLPACKTVEDLKAFKNKNDAVWAYVKEKRPELYQQIATMFTEAMTNLKKGN